ncbi:polymorphic toxin-type HINT domain-containing protein, partial [Cellulomonas oligotrophica]
YSYGEHNPVTFDDPTGMWSLWGSVKAKASSAWRSTTSFVKKHQASIVGFAVGAIVTGGCMALTAGAGSIGCAALGGAAAGAASNLWRTKVQKTSRFTVGGFVRETVFGAAMGAIGGAAAKPLTAVASWAGRTATSAAQRWGAGASSASRVSTTQAAQTQAQAAQSMRSSIVQQVRSSAPKNAPVKAPAARPAQSTAAKACSIAAPMSFAGSTTVLMGDGSNKPIKDVHVGDKVVASDPETGEQDTKPVTEVFVHQDTLVDLHLGDTTIRTTEDHPFWSVTDQRFERADHLTAGELVLTATGDTLTVTGLTPAGTGTAYNLAIADIHTYHVGDNAVLVHNTDPSCGAGGVARASGFVRTEALSGRGSARTVQEIADSMRSGGWQGDPIRVVNLNGQRIVVDGHHRLAAAQRVGIDIPYEVVPPSSVVGPGQWSSVDDILRDAAAVGPNRIR